MVNEVKAWTDTKGNLHKTRLEALEADTTLDLQALGIFKHDTACVIVANAEEVYEAIKELVKTRATGIA